MSQAVILSRLAVEADTTPPCHTTPNKLLLRSRLLTDQIPVEAVVVDCHRVIRTPVETSCQLYMESTGLLGATRSLDRSRVVAGGTASWTQLELGLPDVNFSFNLYCWVGSNVG